MNLQAPRAFSRREKITDPEPSICSQESLGSKPVEVYVERVDTIPSLSSFGESTTIASGESSSFETSFSGSDDSYESRGVISRLEDFIAHEIGNVMLDSYEEDFEEYSDAEEDDYYSRKLFHSSLSQEFSVLQSTMGKINPLESKNKTGRAVDESSHGKNSSLVTTETARPQIDKERDIDKSVDLNVEAVVSDDELRSQSEIKRSRSKDNPKKLSIKKLSPRSLLHRLSSASFGGQKTTIELDSTGKSQSNISQRQQIKHEMLKSSKSAENLRNNLKDRQDGEDLEIDNDAEIRRVVSETRKSCGVEQIATSSREKSLESSCLSPSEPPQYGFPRIDSKASMKNKVESVGPQVSFHETVTAYEIEQIHSGGSAYADDMNIEIVRSDQEESCDNQHQTVLEEGKETFRIEVAHETNNEVNGNCQLRKEIVAGRSMKDDLITDSRDEAHGSSRENGDCREYPAGETSAEEPQVTRVQAHRKSKRRNLKLLASKFSSIKICFQKRKRGGVAASNPNGSDSNNEDNKSSEEKSNGSKLQVVASFRVPNQKDKQSQKGKDWKTKLFRERRQSSLNNIDEVSASFGEQEGNRQILTIESTTPCLDTIGGCITSGAHLQTLAIEKGSKQEANEELSGDNNEFRKEYESLERPLLSDDALLEIISIPSGKTQDHVSVKTEEYGESSSLDVGQEVVGDFESRLDSPRKNLGGFLRHQFRKRETLRETSQCGAAQKEGTLIDLFPLRGGGKKLSRENECKGMHLPATNSIATESTNSLDDQSARTTMPESPKKKSNRISKSEKREIQRLISDLTILRKIERTKRKCHKTQSAKKSSLRMLVAVDEIVQKRIREDNEKIGGQQKAFILFGVTDDFSKIFSCPCQAQ